MKEKPVVFNIQKGCIHDGPGIRTNIFFNGCMLRCMWCANPESQSPAPKLLIIDNKCIGCGNCAQKCTRGAYKEKNGVLIFDRTKCDDCGDCVDVCYAKARTMMGKTYTAEELIEETKKDLPFYKASGGGVTFTGGEPALWPETVTKVARWYHEASCSTAIETCGYAPWENYKQFLPYIDTVLYDIKIWDTDKHKKYCGGDNRLIFENLEKIIQTNETIIRMPIIPGINDSEEELRCIAQYIQSLKLISKVHVLPYHNLAMGKYEGLGKKYPLPEVIPPSHEHMEWVRSILLEYGFEVVIGG